MEGQKQKKRVIKPIEVFFLVIIGLIFVYFGLKSVGVNVVDRSEETAWIDKPRGAEKYTPPRRDDELEADVDATLKNIARRFHEDDVQDRRSSRQELRSEGLSDDEARYMQKVQERTDKGDGTNWLETIRASYNTYKTVRSIFNTLSGRNEAEELDPTAIGRILSNKTIADQIYSNLERNFSIPEEQSRAFANQGKKAMSEWADFVEKNKKENTQKPLQD